MIPSVDAKGRRRLRARLALFLIAVAVPSALLLWKALDQLKWEAVRQSQLAAEEIARRIDARLGDLIREQDARSFADFAFLTVAGDPRAGFLQRSALSAFPVDGEVSGLIGWFQIDAAGRLSTPLLPEAGADASAYGLGVAELAARQALEQRIAGILEQNAVVTRPKIAEAPRLDPEAQTPRTRSDAPPEARRSIAYQPAQKEGQALFDALLSEPGRREAEGEPLGQVAEPDEHGPKTAAAAAAPAAPRGPRGPRIRIFESELDPFRFSRLQSGHFVLFRWAWRHGARYVQGALLEPQGFLSGLIGQGFLEAPLSRSMDLIVTFADEPIAEYASLSGRYEIAGSAQLPAGTVLYASRLQEPFAALRLAFLAERLPAPSGAAVVYWLGLVLALVLAGGVWLLYRLGLRQLALIRQQQDFVAAVSHEMKTPLTSIRMYSEMLREGWVSEAKRPTYYRFIHDESERLSRLVANVLQLARMGRDELRVDPRPVSVAELIEAGSAVLAGQTERAGFELVLDCPASAMVRADPDAVTQILINLVDNAIKFSAQAECQRIEVGCGQARRGRLPLRVRDYGPGIPKAERARVFEPFRRLENEAIRKTQGTGIGLALVERLARAMKAEVELVGHLPGLEVRVWLPVVEYAQAHKPAISSVTSANGGAATRASPR